MSEPNRYTLEMVSSEGGEVHWMHDNGQGLNAPLGEYVLYSDYARLKAEIVHDLNQIGGLQQENARLKAEVESLKEAWVDKKMQEDRDALLLEVERLRKAGDAVCESPYLFETDSAVIAWRAAKEGKPSV